jgi:RNA polymerase sigma-70 factor (ECF subfamily)
MTTEELFRQHAGFVARFLSQKGVPPAQLEDALQEVFLVVHRNGGYRPGLAKPTSYLAGIALRAAARHRQREGVARARHSDAVLEELPGALEDPARTLQVQQDLQRLQLALARLPDELRTPLLLVDVEGESCISVAAGLGAPVGTVYWRLHQARKELQVALRLVDAAREHPREARPELDTGAQPARSWMILFGLDGWKHSEASRLLELARAQPPSTLPVDALLARHHELLRVGAELPAWASRLAPHTASWLGVLGVGPIAAGVTVCAAVIAASMLGTQPAPTLLPQRLARESAPVVANTDEAPRAAAAQPKAEPASTTPEPDRTRLKRAAHSVRAEATAEPAPATLGPQPVEAPANVARALAPKPAPAPEAKSEPLDATALRMGRAVTDAELAEMREIKRAERLLDDDPKRALALTRAMEAGFPEGRFREERAYLQVMALLELGRTQEMRAEATTFLRSYPAGLYSERVRKALAGKGR